MATNMIEIASLPINVPWAPTAAGLMVDPRTYQIVYNPDGAIRYLPALLALSMEKVPSTQNGKKTYQSITIKPNRLIAGHVIRISHFGFCNAASGTNQVFVDVNGVTAGGTGAMSAGTAAFRVTVDLMIASETTAIASGCGFSENRRNVTYTDTIPLDVTKDTLIAFASTNNAPGETTHGGYIAELIG